MTEEEKKAIELIGWLNLNGSYIITSKQSNEQDVHKAIDIILNLIEKLKKENENLKIDLEKANASIVDQTDKDNEIEHLENLLRGNLYDGYLYYKDIAREYQKNYALIEELKNKVDKRNNELIELEETSEKEFLTKQEVNENYIPKDKIREKLEKIEKEKEQYYAAGQHLMYMLLKNQLKSLIEEE